MMNYLDKIIPLSDVPEGELGRWRIEKFSISKKEAELYNLKLSYSGQGDRYVTPGNFTKLLRKSNSGFGRTMMSDTRSERQDHLEAVERATGKILINGLGLGVFLNACLLKEDVEHITVIEIEQDIINLVEPHYRMRFGDRFTVILADALEYTPPKSSRFDVVWHDIWIGISSDNWESMKRLHRKYGRLTNWQGSWCRDYVQYRARKEREKERMRISFLGGDVGRISGMKAAIFEECVE